jgi:hypothetical protein
MLLAFRRFTHDSPELGRIICLATRGSVYHVEIVLADGRCFSSRGTGWPRGVSFLDALPQDNADHWLKVTVPWEESAALLAWCNFQVGKGYDYRAAANSAIGIRDRNPDEWFCSSITAEVLSRAGWSDAPVMPNPAELYKAICAKLGLLAAPPPLDPALLETPRAME